MACRVSRETTRVTRDNTSHARQHESRETTRVTRDNTSHGVFLSAFSVGCEPFLLNVTVFAFLWSTDYGGPEGSKHTDPQGTVSMETHWVLFFRTTRFLDEVLKYSNDDVYSHSVFWFWLRRMHVGMQQLFKTQNQFLL
ncbi:uncharacterized protein [Nothobranchius furzeri]|uniref:uncharacterized protein n=1 Tax=Nothobranchius furzeri TaxID=105023 RepID=UPI003904D77E